MTPAATKANQGWVGVPLNVVISSPSGGGKSTVIKRLLRKHPEFMYSLSVTTRGKRRGERDGVHYRFISEGEFTSLVRSKQLLEWAEVHGHHYGTPRKNVDEAFRSKRVLLFDIDVQGAAKLRKTVSSIVSIFLLPPSLAELKRRLVGRGSETPLRRRKRLETARRELARVDEYDYWITNDRLPVCVTDCEAVIRAELMKRERRQDSGHVDRRLLKKQ